MLSFASQNFTNGGAAMFGVLAIFGDLGCSVGPMLTGIISDVAQKAPSVTKYASSVGVGIEQLALKGGILSGIIFPIVMIAALAAFKTNKKTDN
jgi:predicted MFS family arabinose efflux permease